jgi:hypothetical protein
MKNILNCAFSSGMDHCIVRKSVDQVSDILGN